MQDRICRICEKAVVRGLDLCRCRFCEKANVASSAGVQEGRTVLADSEKRLSSGACIFVVADSVKTRTYIASRAGVQECTTVVADASQRPREAVPTFDTEAADVLQGLEVSFAVVVFVGSTVRPVKRFRFDSRPGCSFANPRSGCAHSTGGSCKAKACAASEYPTQYATSSNFS